MIIDIEDTAKQYHSKCHCQSDAVAVDLFNRQVLHYSFGRKGKKVGQGNDEQPREQMNKYCSGICFHSKRKVNETGRLF